MSLVVPGGRVPASAQELPLAIRDDRYTPIPGGWQIHLHAASAYVDIGKRHATFEQGAATRAVEAIDPVTGRLTPDAPIGFLRDNPRLHRRPLYPPGDKSLVWTQEEQDQTPRVSFRPMVLAYNEPRFLFDDHSAGGLLGHLRVGLAKPEGGDKWFDAWSEIDVRYVEGRLEYTLTDGDFAGTTVKLVAAPLAQAVGLILKVEIEGASPNASLVWAYGGASAYFTNWRLDAPEFSFSLEQCAKDEYTLKGGTFELVRAFDTSDPIVSGEGQSLNVMRFLPQWKAHIKGGSSWREGLAWGLPKQVTGRPGDLAAGAEDPGPGPARSKRDCVVVGRVPLKEGKARGSIVVGMGGRIDEAIQRPDEAYEAAMARNAAIARRIVTHTPDPYLDAAMGMMGFATEGLWASQAYVHGGWTWRYAYLGWRILYGPTVYGWTDRVRRTIENHCRLGRITEGPDQGGLGSLLEQKGFYYNMNEVFIDMVRHYFDYTNDLELMKDVFPVLEGMLDRENRRLRPEQGYLYESALNTWISDSHWYIGGLCTQSSAYMLRAYEFMAELAGRLGKDAAPFREQADQIRAAMQRVLWQKRLGVYAEYVDTRGHRLLHPEPELPTLYHSAEFGAADPLQIDQMLHWADVHLKQEHTPGGGLLYWSSNWFPNRGRSYVHSTHEMAYGEELNFAETNYLAGRAHVGYAILRAALCGIFNGPTPGGLSCHAYIDGGQRANDEFADAISVWGRAVVEGLFGIKVNRPDGCVALTPQLPGDWPEASIATPHFSYRLRRAEGTIDIDWESPVETAIHLTLPLAASHVTSLHVNGQVSEYGLRKGTALTWLDTLIPKSTKGAVRVSYIPDRAPILQPMAIKPGERLHLSVPGLPIGAWADPQGLLAEARIDNGSLVGRVAAEPGSGLLFISKGQQECPRWIPVTIEVEPREPVTKRIWSAPKSSSQDGENRPAGSRSHTDGGAGSKAGDHDLGRWVTIDVSKVFNANVPEVPKRVRDEAIAPVPPASAIGFSYWQEHLVNRLQPPGDAAWRAKVGPDGIAWSTDGIPFKTSKDGPNIGVVCLHNKVYPASLSFSARGRGGTLYLMVSGMSHPVQSHVVNLRVTLHYADSSTEAHDLVSPFDIGDCWSTWCGVYFDTPGNGFENIGGRSGPAGSSQVADLTKPVAVDTIAHLVPFTLRPDTLLESVEVEAIANDVIFGIMGASILKPAG